MKIIALALALSFGYLANGEEFVSVCRRTPAVRDHLVQLIRKNCESITVQDLEGVAQLSLGRRNITKLVSSDFQGLSYTRSLYLYENQIAKIEPGTFSHLTYLENLNLAHNKIGSLRASSFQGLTYLQSLVLNNNFITEIDSDTFLHLTLLKKLDLDQNKIGLLKPFAFRGLTHLTELVLSGNQISEIGPNTFSHLVQLETLNLSRNKIGSLNPYAFQDLNLVIALLLGSNPLSEFNPHLFQAMPGLRHLGYGRTQLQRVPKGVCSGLPGIISIDFTENSKLTEIPDFAFVDCSPRLRIFLEGSPLTQTTKAAFQGVGQVDGLPANFDQDGESWEQP